MNDIKPPFKIFKTHLVNAFFITPEKLYREFKPVIEKIDRFQDGRIYFIVKRPRSRFKNVKVGCDCYIYFKYSSQGYFSKSHKIPISCILHGANSINKDIYPTPESLQHKLVYVRDENPSRRASDPYDNIIYVTPSRGQIERGNKVIEFKLLPSSRSEYKDQSIDIPLFSYQFLRLTGHSQIKSEVLYIGKANDFKTRTDGHERIQQALAECADHEEVYVYFFTPKFSVLDSKYGYQSLTSVELDKMTEEQKVLVCEAGLINYFKPELNVDHKLSDITKSKTLRVLKEHNYTHFVMNCMFDEDDYFFETACVKRSGEHKKNYSLKT